MEYLIGVGLALAVCAFAMAAGFDRDRVFYPTMLIVIAAAGTGAFLAMLRMRRSGFAMTR
jgi:hypothetical protein